MIKLVVLKRQTESDRWRLPRTRSGCGDASGSESGWQWADSGATLIASSYASVGRVGSGTGRGEGRGARGEARGVSG